MHPDEGQWHEKVPLRWCIKEMTISDPLMWIEPYTWGVVTGNAVYFLQGTATYWHFTTERIIIEYDND